MHRTIAALAAAAWAGLAVVAGSPSARADVAGVVRGTLTRPDHQPLPNVTVTLAGRGVSLVAKTAADGSFAFPRVPFGRYHLHAATAAGSADATVEVDTGAV